MKQLTLLTFCFIALFALAAQAAAAQQRVRGTIQSFNQNQLVLQTRSGDTQKVALANDTTYLYVVESSLSKVSENDYIGTATTKKNGKLVALELVIFPESMRGAGEGHYPWDKLPATSQSGKVVSSSMTNGSVKSTDSAASGQKLVSSSMTNGTVQSSDVETSGAKEITVTYEGGQKHIIVPDSAPIVSFEKADQSALKEGAHVFLVASKKNGQLTAVTVAVGKNGLNPPM